MSAALPTAALLLATAARAEAPGALLLAAAAWAEAPGSDDMALVPGGTFEPPYAARGEVVQVPPFRLDRAPVTNAEYLAFVREEPSWRQDRVAEVLADTTYLDRWAGPLEPGPQAPPEAPVTGVSWFAAQAYCEARGKRLPSVAEWEVAARASQTSPDASDDPAFHRRILDWYAVPTPEVLPAVRSGEPNLFGIHDLHGLIWEWVYDYGSVMIQAETRSDGSSRPALVCGGGTLGSLDPSEYATYLRYGLRGGLRGRYTLRNLGFRCALEDE